MKGLVMPTIAVVGIGVPTMIGVVPAWLGVMAMLAIVLIKDILFIFLSRGLPIAMICQRLFGGIIWGVCKRNTVDAERFQPKMGTIQTKHSGSFVVMAARIIRIGGVPFGFAPEKVGYNIGLDHMKFIDKLKERGIAEIREIIDVNKHGQFLGFKNDPRIRDLMDLPEDWLTDDQMKDKDALKAMQKAIKNSETEPQTTQLDFSSFDDFYRYTIEASNPYHNEARIKMGIAQGVTGGGGSNTVLIVVIGAIAIAGLVAMVSLLSGGSGGDGAADAAQNTTNVITAMLPI